jgi:hypothetical protein
MKTIKLEISETGRNSLKDEPTMFNRIVDEFENIDECKEALKARYGRMPNGRNKIYTGPNNNPIVVGFLHSFWNKDWSHNSKNWFQTDWISIYEVETKPIGLTL